MSRWLEAARRAQRSAQPAADETDKTDRTEVSSVSSVLPARDESEIDEAVAADFSMPDPSDQLSDYLERLAICGEAGDVSTDEAHRIATEQCGASLDELVERQLQYWRGRLHQLDKPDNRRLEEVARHCLAALDQPWLDGAVRLGWDARELFGLDPAAPSVSTRNGLVIGLILTSLRRPLDVLSLAADHAVIATASGSQLRHFNYGNAGPAIWEHAAYRNTD